MFKLEMKGFRWERELQIIQADVRLLFGGHPIIDEPLCVDVGMPALAASLYEDATPDRFGTLEEWRTKPFFVCGCGDPECRAYSFTVRHLPEEGCVLLAEVEERGGGRYKVLEEMKVEEGEYRRAVSAAMKAFLSFAEELEGYRPLYGGTVERVRALLPPEEGASV
ncbi:hypothetical protein [Gorillibacterium sp. sgz5001074]|uniref:hypothetical protein n=1 Tax=Gorillibacterium sp. sgz5001074 TaxID=3446695 RepID=UPI003F667F83